MTATCAACGEQKELCDSGRMDGIKQPRLCKECLIRSMRSGKVETNDLYWIQQMIELNDLESILKALSNCKKDT